MGKKAVLLIFFILAGIVPLTLAQQKGVNNADFDAIEEATKLRFGSNLELADVINVDSSIGTRFVADGRITDPYGTLKHCFIFVAKSKTHRLGSPNGFVGVYNNRQILWTSDTVISSYGMTDAGVYATQDLNNDSKVDILVSFFEGMHNPLQYLWIVSWDGQQGKIINAYSSDGISDIVSANDLYQFVDLNGDGVLEIKGDLQDTQFESSRQGMYMWDGSVYREGVPSLPTGSLPRNKLTARLNVIVNRVADNFRFLYSIENKQSSLQEVDDILMQPLYGLNLLNIRGRREWKLTFGAIGARWSNLPFFGNHNFISKGEIDTSFSFATANPPTITKYYLQGHNGASFSGEEILRNSVAGHTLGPVTPLSGLSPSAFLDTLLSYTRQSAELGWLAPLTGLGRDPDNDCDNDEKPEDGIVRNIEQRLNKAKRQLERGDSVLARRELEKLVGKVERLWKRSQDDDKKDKRDRWEKRDKVVMTSEAYALLKYNTEYLIDRLPDRKPKKGSKEKD